MGGQYKCARTQQWEARLHQLRGLEENLNMPAGLEDNLNMPQVIDSS